MILTCNFLRKTLSSFICLLFVTGASVSQDDSAIKLNPFVEEIFEMELAPGMAVAVVQDDEIIYSRGFRYADVENKRPVSPETMFYIASTTKSFTAFAAAMLDYKEVLDLNVPVSRYMPELKFQKPLSADNISLFDLLTHTHGIKDGDPSCSGRHLPVHLPEIYWLSCSALTNLQKAGRILFTMKY